jgi:hypothetical protein
MLTTARTEENRGRGALAALTPQPGEDGGKGRIAVLAHQQADGDDDLTTTAVQFKPALRPVREMVGCSEGRRVHVQTIKCEHIKNKSPFPPFPTHLHAITALIARGGIRWVVSLTHPTVGVALEPIGCEPPGAF